MLRFDLISVGSEAAKTDVRDEKETYSSSDVHTHTHTQKNTSDVTLFDIPSC